MSVITSNNMWQNAWVVPDAKAAAMNWVNNFGAGPFYYGEFSDAALSDLVCRGEPGTLNIMVAAGFAGSMQIELIQRLDDNPNPYNDTVPKGTSMFHHIGVWSDDYDADLDFYVKQGYELAVTGRLKGYQRFAYVDTHKDMNCMVELVEKHDSFVGMVEFMKESASNWDGQDPIRNFPDITKFG
jgi:hypothetical protein